MTIAEGAPAGVLDTLVDRPPDELLALIAQHAADPRADKIDLGVGVYRNGAGITPVFAAIKAAEARLVAEQPTKAYLGIEGDPAFLTALAPIALGDRAGMDDLVAVQTPGGSGALRLAAELLVLARPGARIWIGTPTWPNHIPLFSGVGMTVETYPFVDIATQSMRFDALLDAVGRAAPGDVVLLHGCCHNPTGAELSPEHWQQVVALMVERRVVPLVDLAYQGLGGGLQRDRLGAELCLANFPEVFVAYSCDKNFGLYRERVGALWVKTGSAARVPAVRANLLALARVNWSMPPDHGAAAVRIVLGDPALRAQWLDELEGMRLRLSEVRGLLAERYPALAALRDHTGLFTTLPLPRDAIAMLRDEHGIYMAPSGRINVAGLNRDNLDRFGRAVTPYLTA